MDKLAPNHVIEYCDNVKQNCFVEIYEKYNDFYHRVYQIKCSCHCDEFRIYMDDCPTVIAECSRCKKRIVLYDLDKYDASEKPSWIKWRSPNKFEYSYADETLFNICVMYEYSDDFSSYDDLSWFTAWGYNRNIDNVFEIITDETT